jgi:maleylpyruvate isomerase
MTSGVLGDLSAMRDSTEALLLGLDAEPWHEADVRAPSLLPGWTRGHVLSHIARNADGITRRDRPGARRTSRTALAEVRRT